jgi:hypothetical protein
MSEVDFDLLLDAVNAAVALPEEDLVAQSLPVRQPPRAANDNQRRDHQSKANQSTAWPLLPFPEGWYAAC